MDEKLFAGKEVHCVGNIIGMVAAKDGEIARKIAAEVSVDYQENKPILSIQVTLSLKIILLNIFISTIPHI